VTVNFSAEKGITSRDQWSEVGCQTSEILVFPDFRLQASDPMTFLTPDDRHPTPCFSRPPSSDLRPLALTGLKLSPTPDTRHL